MFDIVCLQVDMQKKSENSFVRCRARSSRWASSLQRIISHPPTPAGKFLFDTLV